MATLEEFYQSVRESGSYHTPAENGYKMAKAGLWATLRFYTGALGAVIRHGNKLLKVDKFTNSTLGELSWMMINGAERMGASVNFTGFERLRPLEGAPVVFVANHMSLVETMLLPAGIFAQGKMIIVAKRSLTRYPAFGRILAASQPILLDRVNPRQDLTDVLKLGAKALEEGLSVLLFPQGTRMASFDPSKFNSLGAKLAMRAKVPLVPIACKTDFSKPGRWLRDFGPIDPSLPIRFEAGPVLDTAKLKQRELQEASIEHIVRCLKRWNMPVDAKYELKDAENG